MANKFVWSQSHTSLPTHRLHQVFEDTSYELLKGYANGKHGNVVRHENAANSAVRNEASQHCQNYDVEPTQARPLDSSNVSIARKTKNVDRSVLLKVPATLMHNL